jgi:hypothetical protein
MKKQKTIVMMDDGTIQVDGVEFVPKEESAQEIPDFNPFSKAESKKIGKALDNMFSKADSPIDFSEALKKENLVVLDPANVGAVVAKSPRAKALLCAYRERDGSQNWKSLDYKKQKKGVSKFSIEYLKMGIALFDCFPSAWLKVAKDYPLTICNNDFEFVCAPRVEGDD